MVGALAFIVPAVYSQDYAAEPIMLLFSFGGILWVIYASVRVLFKHSYFEIAYGGSVLWIIFVIGIAFLSGVQGPLNTSQGVAVLFVAMASLIVVFGSLGITMMFKSTKEFVVDFENVMRAMEGKPGIRMRDQYNIGVKARKHKPAERQSRRTGKTRKRS